MRACVSDGYPQIDLCWGFAEGRECICDEQCQWVAAERAQQIYPDYGCGFYPAGVTCSEEWQGECCFTVTVYEDGCGKGRPLVVDGRTRVAMLQPCADWAGGHEPSEERPEVAERWLQAGLEEHASVASFARFALELVAVGAPAELLADAAAAMRDEVRHAELAFGLAARFGAGMQGPGPLHSGPARSASLEDVVVATVREGCIGETLAAAEAELAATRASDPAVCAALQEIAEDEARHAALAWRVVQWALAHEPSLREVVAQAFAEAGSMDLAPVDPAPRGLEAYGVLCGDTVTSLRAQALRDTVQPFARALLAEVTKAPSAASCTL